MADETQSLAQEPAQPAIEGVAQPAPADEPVNLDAPAIESEQPEQQEPEDDLDELDFGFEKYRVPKKLKAGVEALRADATHKTEAASRTKKEAEALLEQAKAARQASDEEMATRVQLHHIDSELKRLEGYGWNEYLAAAQSDPLGAREAWDYKVHLEGEKAKAERAIGELHSKRTTEAQQDTAKRLEATLDFARKIPGMTQETHEQVLKLAVYRGVPKYRLAEVMDPVVYGILHDAWLGQQVKAAKAAPKPAAAPVTAPLQVVRGNAPATKPVEAINDMHEYAARRKAEWAKRG